LPPRSAERVAVANRARGVEADRLGAAEDRGLEITEWQSHVTTHGGYKVPQQWPYGQSVKVTMTRYQHYNKKHKKTRVLQSNKN